MEAIKELLPAVLAGLHSPELALRSKLVSEWPAIAGQKIAGHTKPTLSGAGRRATVFKANANAINMVSATGAAFLSTYEVDELPP